MIIRIILSMVIFILMTSCSMFSPVTVNSENVYMLNAQPCALTKTARHKVSLAVPMIQAEPAYNTTDMLYSTQRYQLSAFVKNRWAETPAQMLQPLIVQTLANTHYFSTVSSTAILGHYDYVLHTQLLGLQQVFQGRTSVVHLAVRVQLIQASNNRVVATQQFSVSQSTPDANPYGGVVAANMAVAEFLAQLRHFCLQKL